MPNLENLKKQAKQFLRWHRDGEYTVAATIREWLPRYAALSDRDVLSVSFRLSDAQELVARRAGHESWRALREAMASSPGAASEGGGRDASIAPTAARVAAAPPLLIHALAHAFVTDIEASCAYFRDKLGFTVVFTYGEPPFFAEVARDRARLCLRHVDTPTPDPAYAAREQLLAVAIGVGSADELTALFLEFEARSVSFYQKIRKHPWGARDFIVTDPDGNLISFGGPGA